MTDTYLCKSLGCNLVGTWNRRYEHEIITTSKYYEPGLHNSSSRLSTPRPQL